MKIIIPLLLALLTLSACAAPASGAQAGYRSVGTEEAIALMDSEENYLILDVRTAEEFAQGHIPGALNLANENIGQQPPPLLPDKAQLIMVYCRSGNRSKQASQKLADMGYSNVVEFGGITDWPGDIISTGE